MIDSHQHFWKYNPVRDSWINDSMEIIRKDFLPKDLKPILKANSVDGCIAVQADQSEEETEFLLQCAKENPFIKGVVGWVDLRAENLEERLAYFSKNNLFKGVRHIVQGETEGFLLRNDFQDGIAHLSKYNLTYDILVGYKQLSEVITFVTKFPNQSFVLDHLGKPPMESKEIKQWKNEIEALSEFTNVYCKISGMTTEANWSNWKPDDFNVYLDIVFDAFGVHRIMYGSDWPVCLLAAEYKEQLSIIEEYISEFSLEDKTAIMGGNTLKFYDLNL
jgi:L-fuconolactonase